jgi:hypothetical protein
MGIKKALEFKLFWCFLAVDKPTMLSGDLIQVKFLLATTYFSPDNIFHSKTLFVCSDTYHQLNVNFVEVD